jgi:hypothetical protein
MMLRRIFGLGVALAAVGALAVLAIGPAGADITWLGQGVSVPGDCTGTGNTEIIHFILTSPSDSTSILTITTNPGGQQQVTGNQQGNGNGSIHFFVHAPAGATVTSAVATNNSGNSQLTISSCENTNEETTTTTTTTTTTGPQQQQQTTTTTTTVAPAQVSAGTVTVQPTLTG